jgi:alkylation response protein AidB-like acyl-CoA dehydrogenase
MNVDNALRDMARKFFANADAESVEHSDALWLECTKLDWNLVGIDEVDGGVGGSLKDLATLLIEAGRGSVCTPLLEDATARACLADADLLGQFDGVKIVTLYALPARIVDGVLSCSVSDVPWASRAEYMVLATDDTDSSWSLVNLRDEGVRVVPGFNIAGEPRDTVHFENYSPASTWSSSASMRPEDVHLRCALLRGCQLLGVLEKAMELTVAHAQDREQFGKAINKNQAVAHHLAVMRTGIELANVVVEAALDNDRDARGIAMMRSTLGTISEDISARAHQVHAAIGVTREHPLHRSTMRMWAYRDEYGTQRSWTMTLGQQIVNGGADALWQITMPRALDSQQ